MSQLCAKRKPSRLVETALGNGVAKENELLIRKLGYYQLLFSSRHRTQRIAIKLTVEVAAKMSFTDVLKGGILRT